MMLQRTDCDFESISGPGGREMLLLTSSHSNKLI